MDTSYGCLRLPEKIDVWEIDHAPMSLCTLAEGAAALARVEELAQHAMLAAALRAQNYLWIMDSDGVIRIALEELAYSDPKAPYKGYPRRRAHVHPAEEKKLGHPTLVAGGPARIAGELALDYQDGKLCWILNANSGRYCRQLPPSREQLKRIAECFRKLGVKVSVDDE